MQALAGGAYNPESWIDAVYSNAVIEGWALDKDVSSGGIWVNLYVDGNYANAAFTDIYRQDVNNARQVTGNHGYRMGVPLQYQDGIVHNFEVYAIDSSGRPKSSLWLGQCERV